MPLLTNDQKDDIRFHLAYTPSRGIDAGDRAMLESALSQDFSSKWVTRITEAIASCEWAYKQCHSEQDSEVLAPIVSQTIIAGDVNRSTTAYDRESVRARRNAWIAAGNDLAAIFGCANYRTSELFPLLRSARREP